MYGSGDANGPIRPTDYRPPTGPPVPRGARALVRRAAVFAGALLVAAGLGVTLFFVLTARSVMVDTLPADAAVEVSGFSVPLGGRLMMRPGARMLSVSAPGYVTREREILVSGAPSQSFRVELERLPGNLIVSAAGPPEVEVSIDGRPRGTTPVELEGLAPGDYTVRAEAPRYRPFETVVAIEGLGRTETLEVVLEPAWAEVTLATRKGGEPAMIVVDGEPTGSEAGVAPVTVEVLEGERDLEVRRPGFKPWRRTIDVVAGARLEFTDLTFEPADATLKVRSRPAGANVVVNETFAGRTPATIAVSPNAPVTLKVFKSGYEPARRRLTLDAGEERELTVSLDAETGRLALEVSPAGASVALDGRPLDTGAGPVTLTAGRHRLEVSAPGHATFDETVEIIKGETRRLEVELMTDAEAALARRRAEAEARERRLASLPATATTPQGTEMKLIRPHSFTMGASRREAGRRANERLREVFLSRPFYLAVTEVSNAEYRAFRPGHDSGEVSGESLDGPQQPVVNVSWQDAALYANWLSGKAGLDPVYQVEAGRVVGFDPDARGYRLPTEAEWAFAARVEADRSLKKFPWGEEMPPTLNAGNYADSAARDLVARVIRGFADNYAVSAPVGAFQANRFGIRDLGGNVAEWVHDVYRLDAPSGREHPDPMGEATGELHAIRGSSWAHGDITELRFSFRDYGKDARNDLGFRVARSAP